MNRIFVFIALFILTAMPVSLVHAQCVLPTGTEGQVLYNDDFGAHQLCDGVSWKALSPAPYIPNAVGEIATTVGYISDTSFSASPADTKTATFSTWVKFKDLSTRKFLFAQNGAFANFWQIGTGGGLWMRIDNSASAVIADLRAPVGTFSAGVWHHIIISIDMTNISGTRLYVDDAPVSITKSPFVDDFLHFGTSTMTIGKNNGNGEDLNGYLADFWFDAGTYLDLTVEANRRKFIDANGKPVDLGTNGSRTTGIVPDIFLSGDTASWHTNKGTSGGFTEFGTLSTAATNPGVTTTENTMYAFVTPTLASGNLLSIAQGRGFAGTDGVLAADYICQDEADSAGLEGTYFAWISGPDADNNAPADRFYRHDDDYVLPVTLTKVADNWNDLTNGDIDNPIDGLATGTTVSGTPEVWTNVDEDGTAEGSDHCNDWTSGSNSNQGWQGESFDASDRSWTRDGRQDCNLDLSLYCFRQDPLTVTNCSSPDGTAGQLIYNSDDKVLQSCTATGWVALGPVGGTGGSGCVSPLGTEGQILYNDTSNILQYCNGEDWVKAGL